MDHLKIKTELAKTDDDITADLMDAIREADDILFPESESEEENNESPRGTPGPSVTDRANFPQEQAMDSDRPDSPIHPYFLAHPEESPYSDTIWTDEAAAQDMSNSSESEKRLETPISYIEMKPIGGTNDIEIDDGVRDAEENVNIHENHEIQGIPDEIHDDPFEARRGPGRPKIVSPVQREDLGRNTTTCHHLP
ncbi:hypothetical protein JTB14_018161 [Gonioctena quinquepunctata]|nr:hypothetical protein JTB14_018161 [Gonioctena quinquepunctata]